MPHHSRLGGTRSNEDHCRHLHRRHHPIAHGITLLSVRWPLGRHLDEKVKGILCAARLKDKFRNNLSMLKNNIQDPELMFGEYY
jgi:hypothetical protein